MRATWIAMAVMAAALALAASAAQAQSCTVKVQTAAEQPGGEPQIRIWINGKEVRPGDAINLGELGGIRSERRPGAPEPGERAEHRRGEPYLGIFVGPISEEKTPKQVAGGAAVTGVMPGSPAEKAGLEVGDIVAAVDGREVVGPEQLIDLVRAHKPGDTVSIIVYRDGRRVAKSVTLGARPEEGQSEAPPMPGAPPRFRPEAEQPKQTGPAEAFLGVMAAPLTEEVMEIAGTARGVLINSLPDDSPAAQAGLMPGDVIVSVGGKEVTTPAELVETVRTHKPGDTVHVVYFRMKKRSDVEVKLGGRPEGARRPGESWQPGGPEGFYQKVPELRRYLEEMRRGLQGEGERWRDEHPGFQPRLRPPTPAPSEGAPGGQPRQGYDVGKDIGQVMERLERLNRRLDDIERRLDRIEKR